MLIQADARREGKIRAHAYKHSPPTCIVEIDVVLVHPEVCNLEMPAIVLLVPVGDQDPAWLPAFKMTTISFALARLKYRSTVSWPAPPGASTRQEFFGRA